jgi:hypothetical protein
MAFFNDGVDSPKLTINAPVIKTYFSDHLTITDSRFECMLPVESVKVKRNATITTEM